MEEEHPSGAAAASDHPEPVDGMAPADVDASGASNTAEWFPLPSLPEPSSASLPPASSPLDDAPRMLQPRVKTLWRLGFLLQAILPSVLAGVAGWIVWHDEKIWPAIVLASAPWLIAAVLAMRLPARRYAAWQYRLTDDALRLDRGVMVRIESVVPYTRIQHVDTEQGPVERALGLTRVIVHTASGSGSTLTIPGLSPDDATQLREQLALLAGVVEPL
jgi:membrane protein YdbS with pleckstrin-like domain